MLYYTSKCFLIPGPGLGCPFIEPSNPGDAGPSETTSAINLLEHEKI
jgi:hypothetical protein